MITQVKDQITRAPEATPEPSAEPTVVQAAVAAPPRNYPVAPNYRPPEPTEPTMTRPASIPANYDLPDFAFGVYADGLHAYVSLAKPLGSRLLTRVSYLFDDLSNIRAARGRADRLIEGIHRWVAGLVDTIAEDAAVEKAEADLAAARAELAPLVVKGEDLAAKYEAALAENRNPVSFSALIVTIQAELLKRRAELEERAAAFVGELTRELLEIDMAERLIREHAQLKQGLSLERQLLTVSAVAEVRAK